MGNWRDVPNPVRRDKYPRQQMSGAQINATPTSTMASDLKKQAQEIAASAVELYTNDEIESLAQRITAALQAEREQERERIVEIVRRFVGACPGDVQLKLLAAITTEGGNEDDAGRA